MGVKKVVKPYVIVRTFSAGVFAGTLEDKNGKEAHFQMLVVYGIGAEQQVYRNLLLMELKTHKTVDFL